MAVRNLTATSVGNLPFAVPKGAQTRWCVYWDGRRKGLGLRITEMGARSYVVRYRVRGARVQYIKTLGKIEALELPTARDRAKEVIETAERGKDWFIENVKTRGKTGADLWEYYRDNHLASKAISERSRHDANLIWSKHCEREFKAAAVVDITAGHARDWHKRVTESGAYIANRAVQLMRAAWNYGKEFDIVPDGLENPFAKVALNPEKPRKTVLRPHELPQLATAIDALSNEYARTYLWMLFYTGARRNEMLKLQWRDVDLDEEFPAITLQAKGVGEQRRIELSKPARALLEALPKTRNPYVFIGTHSGSHFAPNKLWQEVRQAAKLPDLRMHDLRRSFGSWLGASGYSSKQIGTILGHKTDITSRVYIQLGEDQGLKRDLSSAFAALAQANSVEKPKADVVRLPLRKRR
jgi:integrase